MTYQNAQRITASLPPSLATFIDEYQKQTGTSKSEIIALGLKALQEKLLAEQYAALAAENDPERALFLEGNIDGLEPSDGSEWL